MKETIMRALYFWLLLVIIIQPFLSQRDYLLNLVVKSNASYLAEKAAVEGRITPELVEEIKANIEAVGLKVEDGDISGTTTLRQRGEEIEVVIRVKRPGAFLYNLGTVGAPTHYYSRQSILSEYVP